MEQSSFRLRVQLEFRKNVKLVKLDTGRVDRSLSSMADLRKLVFKTFPEVEGMVEVPGRSHVAAMLLRVKCLDSAGDFVTLENDEDLTVALENLTKGNELRFEVEVFPTRSIGPGTGALIAGGSRCKRSDSRLSAAGAKKEACRYFERGYCKNLACSFFHDPQRRIHPESSRSGRGNGSHGRGRGADIHHNFADLEDWLKNQLTFVSGKNIEQLSGEEGLRVLSQVLECRNLPSATITLFVKLLAKEGVRTSLLRQKTDKIYGVLLGSHFLLKLRQHISSHLQGNPIRAPSAEDVMPYLLLTEELQSRTENGWKELPLDALQSLVVGLEDNADKDEPMAILNRLIDELQNLQRSAAIAPPDKCFQRAKFRQVPIVPTKKELFRSQVRQDLPINHIGKQYSRVCDYLETHFELLREDCTESLARGIKTYRSSCCDESDGDLAIATADASPPSEIRVYSGAQHFAVRCGDRGLEQVFSFELPASDNNVDDQWESSKKLIFGALLCISSDQFQTFFWGIVGYREVKHLTKVLVSIRVVGQSDSNVTTGLQSGRATTDTYVMVESKSAYFEAYYHVLKTLQRQEMEHIPFTKYLLQLEPKVGPPSYLLRRKNGDEYDFSSVFPDIHQNLDRSSVRIRSQSEWCGNWGNYLDKAQQDALKHGLTKELAIIQGPPGTGKTFLGLILVKILLANLSASNTDNGVDLPSGWEVDLGLQESESDDKTYSDIRGPIAIICYTNHALDQFLEGLYRNGETNLIRIGGQSKSDLLTNNNLKSLLMKQRTDRQGEGSHRRFFGKGRQEKDELESQIHDCIDIIGTELVTSSMLSKVATPEQSESLFLTTLLGDESSKRIVDLWLKEEGVQDRHLAHHFFGYDQGFETVAIDAEAEVKPLRGRMKTLPKSDTDSDGDGTQPKTFEANETGDRMSDSLRQKADDNTEREPIDGDWMPDNPLQNAGGIRELGKEPGINNECNLHNFVDAPDVWQLNLIQRRKLHEHWLEAIRMNERTKLKELTRKYEQACKDVLEVENEIKLSLLRKAKVVGMTTTAAAKYYDVVKSLKPEIIVVEEAAEVLEGHILACLSPCVKHLILIGDHLQLRPSLAVYRLSVEHKLDVSMFERLVKSGVEHVTLQEQRRMRPSISKLVKSLYPRSRDHKSVTFYESVKGVKSNVFFFDHKSGEDNEVDGTATKVNSTEAKLVLELCLYLLNQGYKPESIVILSMYAGQLAEIKTLLGQRGRRVIREPHAESDGPENPEADGPGDLPRVSSVDDYQGEESDIIILSLVRSNSIITDGGVGKIGFLKTPNRICVALTRARMGLFVFGNADLLAEKSTLWNEVITSMRNDGELGPELELCCQNHPERITRISTLADFKEVEDGGCGQPCDYQLECGHACPRRCHPAESHDLVVCPKICMRLYDDCPHRCDLPCHGSEDCPPCVVIVTKQMPNCGHEQGVECRVTGRSENWPPCVAIVTKQMPDCGHDQQGVECSADAKDHPCRSNCPKVLDCGHQCTRLCGRQCAKLCEEQVLNILSCGHSTRMPCHEDPVTYLCEEPCLGLLQDCKHLCQGSCGKCKQGITHIPCQQKCGRTLPCGHFCEAGCSRRTCPPCRERCTKRCFHGRCSQPCGIPCKPCREPCSWQCEHHKCGKSCHELCTRPRCNLSCPKLLPKCGHRCIGLCGEPCPTKCRVCHPEALDLLMRRTLEEFEVSDKFVELDCGHIFEVSGLDVWMSDMNEKTEQPGGNTSIKVKECPECRAQVWRTHRYSNVVKTNHSQLEGVKNTSLGHEKTGQGNTLLETGDNFAARYAFLQALQYSPGLMEAHYGTGRAFCVQGEYAKAVAHLSFIAKRSSFSHALPNLIDSTHGLSDTVNFVEKVYGSSSSKAEDSIAKHAIVEWAVAFRNSGEFTWAIELCNVVLARDPEDRLAAKAKEKAEKEEEVFRKASGVRLGSRRRKGPRTAQTFIMS